MIEFARGKTFYGQILESHANKIEGQTGILVWLYQYDFQLIFEKALPNSALYFYFFKTIMDLR